VDVRSLSATEAFVTADGSTIRELCGLPTGGTRNQSLAEATLAPGQATERHYHGEAEEIYFVLEGEGELELDGKTATLRPGDAVPIPPGTWHQLRAGEATLRILCSCAPPYRHEDTHFA